jgi:hypothetical protein
LEDTANVTLAELNIAIGSPGSAPRVLDKEVVLASFGSIADGEDTVVQLGTASGSSDNTGLILLEGGLVGLNSNGDRTLVQSSLKLGAIHMLDIMISGGTNNTLRFRVLASEKAMRLGNVRIIRLGLKRVGFSIRESSVHHTTVAAHVQPRAVNKLLLRKRNELTGLDLMSTFERSSSGERPARTALSLVLNWGNSTLSDPVDLISEVFFGEDLGLVLALDIIDLLITEESFLLLKGPVGQEVSCKDVGVGRVIVVGLNLGKVLGEKIESESVLGLVGVDLVVLSDVREEFGLSSRDRLFSSEHVGKVM